MINWYPGHMAKSLAAIEKSLAAVDIALYLLDARAPRSSLNPSFGSVLRDKPVLYVLNKADLADETQTRAWLRQLRGNGNFAVPIEAVKSGGAKGIPTLCRKILSEKMERYAARGVSYTVKAMALGVPNCGKSTLLNNIAGAGRLKAEDRPGVTRAAQWLRCGDGFELLDTPGVLWGNLKDQTAALHLAYIGSIRDEVFDTAEVARALLTELWTSETDKNGLAARYKLDVNAEYGADGLQPEKPASKMRNGADGAADNGGLPPENTDDKTQGGALLTAVAKARGCLIKGGGTDTERAAAIVLDDFRAGRLGRITLDKLPTENRFA